MSELSSPENSSPSENNPPPLGEIEVYAILAITIAVMFILGEFCFKFFGKGGFIIAELLVVLPMLVFLLKGGYDWKYTVRFNPVSLKVIGLSIVIGLGVLILTDEIQRLINMLFPMPKELEESIIANMKVRGVWEVILVGTGVVIAAGLGEEMFFRGFFQGVLEERKGVTTAVLTTSLVFSLIHLNPWWMVQILLLSFALSLMAWRADSIIPCAIVHAINNGAGLLSANADLENIRYYDWGGHVSPVFLLLAAGMLYFGFRSFFRETRELHNEPLTGNRKQITDNRE